MIHPFDASGEIRPCILAFLESMSEEERVEMLIPVLEHLERGGWNIHAWLTVSLRVLSRDDSFERLLTAGVVAANASSVADWLRRLVPRMRPELVASALLASEKIRKGSLDLCRYFLFRVAGDEGKYAKIMERIGR